MTTNNDQWLKDQCNRYVNGECKLGVCLGRGGVLGAVVDYSAATCEAHEILKELESLRKNQNVIRLPAC